MVVDAHHHFLDPERVAYPWMTEALDPIGARRLLFGSDWPVCLLAASYEQVHRLARGTLARLTEIEQDAVFGGNAVEVYGLRRLG